MSTNTLKLKIITPEKIIYTGEVSQVSVPTTQGEVTILPDHMPLVSLVHTGELRIVLPGQSEMISFSISKGILEVRPSSAEGGVDSEVIILAIRSEVAKEIDIDRAKQAYDRAKQAMIEKEEVSPEEYAKYRALVDKELNRIRVAEKSKK